MLQTKLRGHPSGGNCCDSVAVHAMISGVNGKLMMATHHVAHVYMAGFIMLVLPGGDDSGNDLWFQLNHVEEVCGIVKG